jgi:NAD(P)-dependent dehydrogenase (short-subunit alcohol dehydrogenase family)
MSHAYRILVTGASSGFGKLAAQTLAKAGHTVFAGMRDPSGRNAVAKAGLMASAASASGSIEVVNLDVTDDAVVDAAVGLVQSSAGGLDVVVNNAGIAAMGILETFTADQAALLFQTNVIGVHRVNRAVLPLMRKGSGSLLIHVSSVLGRYVIPFLGIYTATKFALEALAETYRYELAPIGIESVLVQPGTFPTNIMANMLPAADSVRASAYGGLDERQRSMRAMLEALPANEHAADPQLVADAILRIVSSPPGSRPLRTVVDPQGTVFVDAVNQASAGVQAQLFGMMGMSDLLNTTTAGS